MRDEGSAFHYCFDSHNYPMKDQCKLSEVEIWPCHDIGLIKTIQTMPHNLYVSFKLTSLYCGLRLILVYPNLQETEADLKLTYRLWGIV